MDTKQLGPWQFNAADFSISDNQQHIELEPLLCKLLVFFASNPGRIVSRQELIDAIWQQSFVDDNAINRAISELRKVLQHPTLQQSPIKTHHRKGYSLQLATEDAQPTPNHTSTIARSNVGTSPNVKRYLSMSIIVILLATAAYWWLSRAKPETVDAASANPYQVQHLTLSSKQKVTWFKGVESRPLLSPDKQLLAFSHALEDGSMRILVRKAMLSVTGQAQPDIAIESADAMHIAHSWQPQTRQLLIQSITKDGKHCQYLNYDFSQFPDYKTTLLSQCNGFAFGNSQVSADGQWLYHNVATSGMYSGNSLVVENLNTANIQTLVAAPATGLGVTMQALSADGSKLAYILMPESNRPEVFIYTPETREHQRLLSFPFPILLMGLDWSPDQSQLYLPGTDAILKLDIASKALTIMKLPDDVVVGELTLASDNQAYTSALSANSMTQSAIQLVKVSQPFDEARRQFTPLHDAEGSAISPAFSPTIANRYAFAANWSGGWQLWLNDNGQQQQLTEFADATEPINNTGWSSDGRFISFVKHGNLYLYDLQQKRLIPKLENNDIGQPVWLPDNSGIVLTRLQQDSQNLWQLDLMSNQLTQLSFGGGNQPQFDANGQLLFQRDGRLFRYVDGRRADIELLGADDNTTYTALSQIFNNEQWRFGMLGHIQRRNLDGEVLQQTQLPYQLVGMHVNPFNPDELYLTVFVTPEMALEFIEWQVTD